MRLGRWRGAVDKNTGRIYYYHTFTKEATWVKPQEMIDKENKKRLKKEHAWKKPSAPQDQLNEKVIEAMGSQGVSYFLDETAKKALQAAIEKKDYLLAKKTILDSVVGSPKSSSNPMTMSLVQQISTNNTFDIILSIKMVGEATILKEGGRIVKAAPAKTSLAQAAPENPSLPGQEPKQQPQGPPAVRTGVAPKPQVPLRAGRRPPPPMGRQPPPSMEKCDMQPPPLGKILTPPAIPPEFPVPEQALPASTLLPPPISILPPPIKPDSTTSTTPSPASSQAGRMDFLEQIKKGKDLKKTPKKKDSVPSPPPADKSMENALRLRLEDTRQYLAEINDDSSTDDSWDDDDNNA